MFECTVHEVSEPKDAEINEEFATSLGMESLEKLKDAMREQIGRDYEQMSRGHMKKDLLDQLSDGHDFDLPPSMVDMEFNQFGTNSSMSLKTINKSWKTSTKAKRICGLNIAALPSVVCAPDWCWPRSAIIMKFRLRRKN